MVDTATINLVDTEWTEILGNNTWIKLQIKTDGGIFIHLNGDTQPPLSAPAFFVESFQPVFDIVLDNLPANANVWARAERSFAQITVLRRNA